MSEAAVRSVAQTKGSEPPTRARAITRDDRHLEFRVRHYRVDRWLAITALIASLAALPLAAEGNSAEAASALAVAAVALLAGHRWAVSLVVLGELLLAPTLAMRAIHGFVAGPPLDLATIAAAIAVMFCVPGVLAIRRGASAAILIAGVKRTTMNCRLAVVLFVMCAVAAML